MAKRKNVKFESLFELCPELGGWVRKSGLTDSESKLVEKVYEKEVKRLRKIAKAEGK